MTADLIKDSLFLENKLTPLTPSYLAYLLNEGWKLLFGQYPKREQVALLWAQVSLETGYRSCHLSNFGNIKKIPGHTWTMFRCSEILAGKEEFFDPPSYICGFNAYASGEEGAKEYIQFLSQRKHYARAWAAVLTGDPEQYSHALKLCNYYTASESLYTKGIIRLTTQFMSIADRILVPGAPSPQRPKSIYPAPPKQNVPIEPETPIISPADAEHAEIMSILASVPQLDLRHNEPDHNDINEISPIDLGPELKVTGILQIIFQFILKLIQLFNKKK